MSKKDLPYQPWFWTDWFGDADVQALGHATRCVWFEMLGRMWESSERGILLIGGRIPTDAQLARCLGFGSDVQTMRSAVAEIEALSLFSRREDGAIYSRRIVRDIERSEVKANNGRSGGKASAQAGAQAGAQAKSEQVLKPIGIGIGIGNGFANKTGKEERREESVERREERAGWMLHLSRLIAAGPPTWMHYEMPAVEPWRYLGETRPDIEPEEIIQAAAEYRQYVARIGTAPRYIKRPASWISGGGWLVDYATLGEQESAPIETPAEKKKREREERNAALMADIKRMEEEMNHGRM